MSMFSAMLNCLGLDMGSSQVRIYQRDKVLLEEASTAVVDNISGQVLGFGTEALIIYHKEPENYTLEWPVRNGVIADYDMTKSMLRFFLNKSLRRSVSRPTLMVAIPAEISSVTRHALVDALIHAGAQGVYLIPSPAAAAIGAGRGSAGAFFYAVPGHRKGCVRCGHLRLRRYSGAGRDFFRRS